MNIKIIPKSNVKFLNNKDVYIYGAGELAQEIEKSLKRFGILKKTFLVDDEFSMGTVEVEPLSTYTYHDGDIVINGVASVKAFKNIEEKGVFPILYLMLWVTDLWKYDEGYFAERSSMFAYAQQLYEDDLSRRTAEGFIRNKREESDLEILNNLVEDDIYFNKLTSKISSGAFVDCGAYNGDTVRKYISFIRQEVGDTDCKVYAFEPDKKNFGELVKSYGTEPGIDCINKGVWDKREILFLDEQGNMASSLSPIAPYGEIVEVEDIDSVVLDNKVAFIKMDIEGSEYQALIGARGCIMRDHPVLAISAYHRKEDLIELPKVMKSFEDASVGYKLYLRHHGVALAELVLYAIPYARQGEG